jgi:hypothetical protein
MTLRVAAPLLALAAALAGSPAIGAQAASRVVAVGDVHGALDAFVGILQAAGLVDAGRHWAGGAATFVQTGDVTDRGRDVRGALDLLMALEAEAPKAGGRVLSALGNHEVMNLVGEYRDVTPEIFATFADGRSEARREEAFTAYEKLSAARRAARPGIAEPYTQTREAWMAAHPAGFIEYAAAFGAEGRYGKWLRGKPAALLVDGTVFMHAGAPPAAAPPSVEEVVAQVRGEITRFDAYRKRLERAGLILPFFTLQETLQATAAEIVAFNAMVAEAKAADKDPDVRSFDVPLLREGIEVARIGDWALLAGEGPLWFRGYATQTDAALEGPLTAMLAKWRASRMVVAHTVMREDFRIRARLDGRVFLIDTGMLAAEYGGRASALELSGGAATAVYTDGRQPLLAAAARP